MIWGSKVHAEASLTEFRYRAPFNYVSRNTHQKTTPKEEIVVSASVTGLPIMCLNKF